MSRNPEQLRSLIQHSLDGSITELQLSKLVQIARAICEAHFLHLRASVWRLASDQGIAVTELAYDCLGEAFGRDSQRRLPAVQSFVDSLNAPLDSIPDDELVLALKGFLTSVADAQLARIYAQADPSGAKIHRNIREALKGATCFSLARDFRGLVLQPAHCDTLDEQEPFPFELLQQHFLEHARHYHNIPELLQIFYAIVSEQAVYRRSLTLYEVTQLCKLVYVDREEVRATEEIEFRADGLSEAAIEQLRSHVERALKEKIVVTYLAKGKLDRQQAEGIFCALSYMMKDWASDGTAASLYKYVHRYLEMSEEEYNDAFRTKMEYLLRFVREEFAARLMKEL